MKLITKIVRESIHLRSKSALEKNVEKSFLNPRSTSGNTILHFPIPQNDMIYAQQNGHVVLYIGGEEPFIMMPPSKTIKAKKKKKKKKKKETFRIQLI